MTNEGKEVPTKQVLKELGFDEESEYLLVDPDNPVPNPELGPLERRVSVTFEEALDSDEVDPEAERYWFTEPVGGWKTEKQKLKYLDEDETDDIDILSHTDVSGRQPLSAFHKGQVIKGTIVKQMLYHGFQVDFGAHWDGLIAARTLEQWGPFLDHPKLALGEEIECEIFAMRDESVFRFPVQLIPTDQDLARLLPNPELHQAPVDLRNLKPTDAEEFAKKIGRDWEPQKVVVPPKDLSLDDVEPHVTVAMYTDEDFDNMDAVIAGLYD